MLGFPIAVESVLNRTQVFGQIAFDVMEERQGGYRPLNFHQPLFGTVFVFARQDSMINVVMVRRRDVVMNSTGPRGSETMPFRNN